MKQTFKLSWVLIALLALTVVTACKKDDDEEAKEVIAGFTATPDATNTLMYTFTNTSQNATSYAWEFGDGTTSNEANPTHTYAAAGSYSVKLTATGPGGTDAVTQPLTVVNANEQLNILTGGSSRTWKVIRDASTGRYPLEVGPYDRSTIWWAMGLNNDELALRPCILNDEWTFNTDGEMLFDDKGDYWAEGSVYPDDIDDQCSSSSDPMLNANGEDVSAWGGQRTHAFDLADGKLTVTGLGAFIGLAKVATEYEVMVPQDAVTYNVIKLSEGTTDTLVIETEYFFAQGDPTPGGYWRFTLVHYDDPNDEPPIPGPAPIASFDMVADGLTVTFTNTTAGDGNTYAWDFGDGQTSTEVSPVHTYATPGIYTVKLTASNSNGSSDATKTAFLSDVTITDAILQGGAWKIRDAATSVFVGPGLGDPSWWQVPYTDLQPGGGWYCMMNDEFIFSAGGVYEYKTNGDARNDGYKGQAAGCFTDAELAGQDFPFLSATHTYVLNTDGPTPYIELTNGASQAAFIGFYKGYYGGENDGNATAPNGGLSTNRYEVLGYANTGTKEYLFLSVDLNGATEGGAAWSVILER